MYLFLSKIIVAPGLGSVLALAFIWVLITLFVNRFVLLTVHYKTVRKDSG